MSSDESETITVPPRPWAVAVWDEDDVLPYGIEEVADPGWFVASKMPEETAEWIARAANMHDALVECADAAREIIALVPAFVRNDGIVRLRDAIAALDALETER